jgi:hypothetical protein
MKNVLSSAKFWKLAGPAIAATALESVVQGYIDTDPEFSKDAENIVDKYLFGKVPGGDIAKTLIYFVPYVGTGLATWDAGWNIGRLIANIPGIKDALESATDELAQSMSGLERSEYKDLHGDANIPLDNKELSLYKEMMSDYRNNLFNGVDTGNSLAQTSNRYYPGYGASGKSFVSENKLTLESYKKMYETALKRLRSEQRYISVPSKEIKTKKPVGNPGQSSKLIQDKSSVSTDGSNVSYFKPSSSSFLSRGSRGMNVISWQKFLSSNGYSIVPDGIFGSKTESATRDFQKKSGIRIDGIVGPETTQAAQRVRA